MEDIEDTEFVASEHDRLLSAISKLDKTQHITEPTRNEPTNINSEFGLLKRTKKLDLSNVVAVLGDTSHNLTISKKLRRTQDGSKTLPKPLEKPQIERIKRSTGYEETKTKIGRWDPVVARNRTVDFVSFPLKSVTGKPKKVNPSTEFLARLTSKSSLEMELDEIDPPPAIEEEEEEEQSYPMSYEEMVEHRQHLAKMRAQQSYQAAKAKRQSKIKSKKYHRVLKKEKLKLQLKEFEELQKTDPEEALKKLEGLEKSRALERHTLRHKNTGKWAKNKLVRAKYDKEVRQELAEQLAVSRSLTRKTQDINSTDDDDDDNDEATPATTLAQDPMNPWMMQRSDKSNVNAEFDFGYKKYLKNRMYKRKEEDESDNETPNDDLTVLKETMRKLTEENESSDSEENREEEKVIVSKPNLPSKEVKKNKSNSKLVATSQWEVEAITEHKDPETTTTEDVASVFDSFENSIAKQVESKLKKIRQNIEKLEKKNIKLNNKKNKEKDNEEIDNLEYLKLRNKKVKPIIDEELMETTEKNVNDAPQEEKSIPKLLNTEEPQVQNNRDVDPSKFIEVKPKYLNTTIPSGDNEFDQLDDDDQIVPRVNIEEVFEEDDVVANFRQEKEDEINNDNPEDIELNLPGWGSWGGKGVKAPKRKRNRFILKAPPKVPRRDENKGDIIIKEYKDAKLSSHKVSDVPFPFKSVKEYEASIRAPLGNTFIPEKAHKQLIKPSVITRAGAVIEPMTQEELLSKKNKSFNNAAIIKLLGQK